MSTKQQQDFLRITEAINYIVGHFKDQPDLEEVARIVGVSPFHFQRLFTKWAGTSPKKFLQYISIEHAKQLLQNDHVSVLRAAYKTGFSSPSRLHDLFVNIEGMTPAEYKNGGAQLRIEYGFLKSPFGKILVASTPKGICFLAFADHEGQAFKSLQKTFPKAIFLQKKNAQHKAVEQFFHSKQGALSPITLHVKGTPFQLKVWSALLKIPTGGLSTYGTIAKSIGNSSAMRAVGTAVGDNPVAYLIPCHRVIRSTGIFGNYHWGSGRKVAMIGWESALVLGNEEVKSE